MDGDSLEIAKEWAEIGVRKSGEDITTAYTCAQLAIANALIALVERLDKMTGDAGGFSGVDLPALRTVAYSRAE